MDIWLIGGIILLGLLIVIAEIFFLPGTTVIGIIGGIIVAIGIYLGFAEHGMKTGSIILGCTLMATCVLLYAGFRTYSSGKIALKEVSEGKAPITEAAAASVGDEGVTVSYLRPEGKALINGNKVEVFSLGEYIEANKKIKVVKIAENKIFVTQIKET
ncbi:MAG TPA: NfeD family protein [Chitinophagales bacterium]|nr:NfeD family protein [Chitinophagales bacterium]